MIQASGIDSASMNEGRGLKGPGATAMRPETGRSRPGQDEAGRKPGGGPNRGADVQIAPLTWA